MKTPTHESRHFRSTDLYLAAFMQAHGAVLLRADRIDQRIHFVFADTRRCEELKRSFLNNGHVKVGDLRRCLQDLKTTIFAVP